MESYEDALIRIEKQASKMIHKTVMESRSPNELIRKLLTDFRYIRTFILNAVAESKGEKGTK